MTTKLISTLMILFSMMIQPVYGFDFLKELNPLKKKKTKVSKRSYNQNLKMVKNYDVSNFSPEQIRKVRETLIEMGKKFEKNYKSTKTSYEWNDYIEQSIESFLILKAHANDTRRIPHGQTCPFSMYQSVSLWGLCDDPGSERQKGTPGYIAYHAQAKASGCSANQFACPSEWFGQDSSNKGICVPRTSSKEYTNDCKNESTRRIEAGENGFGISAENNGGNLDADSVQTFNSTAHSFQETCGQLDTPEARRKYGCDTGMDQLAETRNSALQNDVDTKLFEVEGALAKVDDADKSALLERQKRLKAHKVNLEQLEEGKGPYADKPEDYIKTVEGDLDDKTYNDSFIASQAATAARNTELAETNGGKIDEENAAALAPGLESKDGFSTTTVSCGSFATQVEGGKKCKCLHGKKQIVEEADIGDCEETPDAVADVKQCDVTLSTQESDTRTGIQCTCKNDTLIKATPDEVLSKCAAQTAALTCGRGEEIPNSDPLKCNCTISDKTVERPAAGDSTCKPDQTQEAGDAQKLANEKCQSMDSNSTASLIDGGGVKCSCTGKAEGEDEVASWDESGSPPENGCPATAQTDTDKKGEEEPVFACGNPDEIKGIIDQIKLGSAEPEYAELEDGEANVRFPGTEPFESCQAMTAQSWETASKESNYRFKLQWHNLYRQVAGGGEDETTGLAELITEYKREWINYHGMNNNVEYKDGNTITPVANTSMESALTTGDSAHLNTKNLTDVGGKIKRLVNNIIKESYDLRDEYKKCASVASMTKFTDYSDEDQTTPDQEVKSMDGKINCKTAGAETQDFGECKAGVTAYNAAVIGAKGMDIYDQVDMADFQMDQQLEMQKNAAAGAGGDFTLALKQQKASMEKGVEALQRRAVFSGVKMGVFTGVMLNMPTQKDLIKQCKKESECTSTIADSYHAQLMAKVFFLLKDFHNSSNGMTLTKPAGSTVQGDFPKIRLGELAEVSTSGVTAKKMLAIETTALKVDTYSEFKGTTSRTSKITKIPLKEFNASQGDQYRQDEEMVCSNAMQADPGVALLQNEGAREAMKQELFNAGAELVTQLLQMNILKKQIQKLEDAINGIQNLEPIPLTFTGEDLLATLCSPDAFPQHPDCINLDPNRTFGFPDQSFNINPPDPAGTNGGNLADNLDSNVDNAIAGGSDPTRRVRSNSRPIAGAAKGGNGGLRVSGGSGGTKGGGGLGGSGSAGGASASAPGGGGGGGGAGAPGRGSSKRGSIAYGGSSAGSLGGRGGARSLRKKKKSKNPFANFKKKNGKGGVLNFRNPAGIGSKSSDIFKMISNGYSRAVKRDQLLRYTEVKKKK
jgi:hypothetical protein